MSMRVVGICAAFLFVLTTSIAQAQLAGDSQPQSFDVFAGKANAGNKGTALPLADGGLVGINGSDGYYYATVTIAPRWEFVDLNTLKIRLDSTRVTKKEIRTQKARGFAAIDWGILLMDMNNPEGRVTGVTVTFEAQPAQPLANATRGENGAFLVKIPQGASRVGDLTVNWRWTDRNDKDLTFQVGAMVPVIIPSSVVKIWRGDDHQLTWKDFTELPDMNNFYITEPGKTLNATDEKALSQIELEVEKQCYESGDVRYRVTAVFYGAKSIVISDSKVPNLLAHEQGHFDIGEWQSRLLFKELRKVIEDQQAADKSFFQRYCPRKGHEPTLTEEQKGQEQAFKALVARTIDTFRKETHLLAQKQYDTETGQSTKLAEQERWNVKIKQALKDTADDKNW